MTATATSRADRLARRSEYGRPDPVAAALARQAQAEADAALIAQAEEEEAEFQAKRAVKITEVTERLPEAIAEVERIQVEYVETFEKLARLSVEGAAAYGYYTSQWGTAERLGLPVPVRLMPVAVGDAVRIVNSSIGAV